MKTQYTSTSRAEEKYKERLPLVENREVRGSDEGTDDQMSDQSLQSV